MFVVTDNNTPGFEFTFVSAPGGVVGIQYVPGTPFMYFAGQPGAIPYVQLAVIVSNATVYIVPSGRLNQSFFVIENMPGSPPCTPPSGQGCLLQMQNTGPCGCFGNGQGGTRTLIPMPPYDLCNVPPLQYAFDVNNPTNTETFLSYQVNSNGYCPTGGILNTFCGGYLQGYTVPVPPNCACGMPPLDPFYGSNPP